MKASDFVMNEKEREMATLVQACIDAHGDDDEPNEVVVLRARNKLTGQFEVLLFNILYDEDGGAEVLPLAVVFDRDRNVLGDYELAFDAEDDLDAAPLKDYVPTRQTPRKKWWEKIFFWKY